MIEFNGRLIRDEDVAKTMEMVEFYRSIDLLPLPSRSDAKRPLVTFRDCWEGMFDGDPWDTSKWLVKKEPHPLVTTNIQVVLGRHYGIMAIDLDGEEAQKIFPTWGRLPKTWVTHSGGGGQHWWFRVAKSHPSPLPAAFLWKGEGGHSGIERLCDRSLIVAPPSIHPTKEGRRYDWFNRLGPDKISLPAMAPEWLLRKKPVAPPRAKTAPPRPTTPWSAATTTGRSYRFDQVADAIPDKVAVASAWGLRFTGRVTHAGWAECHAYDRPDAKPSAVLHTETGYYVDRGGGNRMGLFDLGVQLGIAPTAQEVLQQLGDRYVR